MHAIKKTAVRAAKKSVSARQPKTTPRKEYVYDGRHWREVLKGALDEKTFGQVETQLASARKSLTKKLPSLATNTQALRQAMHIIDWVSMCEERLERYLGPYLGSKGFRECPTSPTTKKRNSPKTLRSPSTDRK